MTGKTKKKVTYYINKSTWNRINEHIALNYASTYGASSQTADEAFNYYLNSPNSVKPYQSEKFIKPKEGTT